MLLIDATQKRWAALAALILALATADYLLYSRSAPHGPTGGSRQGLMFGVLGAGCMVFAGLLAARKKVRRMQIGSAQWWLRGHIWLGLLSVPLVLFHAGFRWGGPLEKGLLAVFGIVIASGVVGLMLQQVIPRLLTVRVPYETFDEQVPHVCSWLRAAADFHVAQVCGPLPVPREGDFGKAPGCATGYVVGGRQMHLWDTKLAVYQQDIQECEVADSAATGDERLVKVGRQMPDVGQRVASAVNVATRPPEIAATGTPTVEDQQRPLSKAEKIALMKAGKSGMASPPASAAQATASPSTSPSVSPSGDVGGVPTSSDGTAPVQARSSNSERGRSPTARPASTGRGGPQPATPLAGSGPLLEFYLTCARPFLHVSGESSNVRDGGSQKTAAVVTAGPPRRMLSKPTDARVLFGLVRQEVPTTLHSTLERLSEICDERRQLEVQTRLHNWLHGWLRFVHIPMSWALLVLGIVHVVASLYY